MPEGEVARNEELQTEFAILTESFSIPFEGNYDQDDFLKGLSSKGFSLTALKKLMVKDGLNFLSSNPLNMIQYFSMKIDVNELDSVIDSISDSKGNPSMNVEDNEIYGWLVDGVREILSEDPHAFFIDKENQIVNELLRLILFSIDYRSHDVYYKPLRESVYRFGLPLLVMNIDKDELRESGNINYFTSNLKVACIPILTIWNRGAKKKERQIKTSLATFNFVLIMESDNLSVNQLRSVTSKFELPHSNPFKVTLENEYPLLYYSKGDVVWWGDSRNGLPQKVVSSILMLLNCKPVDTETVAQHISQSRMCNLNIKELSSNQETFHLSDFRYLTDRSLIGRPSHDEVVLADGITKILTYPGEGRELKDEELIKNVGDEQIHCRGNGSEFFNENRHLLVTVGAFEENFPVSSHLWWLAANIILMENLSNQLSTIYEYDQELKKLDESKEIEELRELRKEQIMDLETIFNIQTLDFFFREEVRSISTKLGTDTDYKKIQEKIEYSSSDVLVKKQIELTRSQGELLTTIKELLSKQGDLLTSIQVLQGKQDRLNSIMYLLTIGLLTVTVIMGVAAILGLTYSIPTFLFIALAILVVVLVFYRAKKMPNRR